MIQIAGEHAVMTGPIGGTQTLADGTVVDVSGTWAYVDSEDQAAELADLISKHYVASGHPSHDDEHPFIYQEG